VRVHFYGDYRVKFKSTPYEPISDLFDRAAENTTHNDRFRLFFGAFADNYSAAKFVAEFAIEYHKNHGRVPAREEIVSAYYGEFVEKADLFIGFDRFSVFDYPLLNSGEEDLYFMVAPSLYLTEEHLRRILYDHVFSRRVAEPEYGSLPPRGVKQMKSFYENNRKVILGIGSLDHDIWYPNI